MKKQFAVLIIIVLILGTLCGCRSSGKEVVGIYECIGLGEAFTETDPDDPFAGLGTLFMSEIAKNVKLNLDKDHTGSLTGFGKIRTCTWKPKTRSTPGKLLFKASDGSEVDCPYEYSGGVLTFSLQDDEDPDQSVEFQFRKVG